MLVGGIPLFLGGGAPTFAGWALFGFGYPQSGGVTSVTNTVSRTGVVANDTTGVGTGRYTLAAASFGG